MSDHHIGGTWHDISEPRHPGRRITHGHPDHGDVQSSLGHALGQEGNVRIEADIVTGESRKIDRFAALRRAFEETEDDD